MDVLIIMDTFAPYNSCGSIPNTKLVKYLAREDLHLTLLTIDVAPGMPVDYSLLPKEMDRITTYRMRHSWLYIKTVNALRQKAKKSGTTLKMKAEKRPLRARAVSKIMDLYYSFQNKDLYRNGVRKIRKHLMNKRFDIVYSSYPSSTSHALAQYVMEHHIAKKWVADFRDPMAYMEFYSDEYEEALASQHQLERAADHVVVVSEGAMDKFRFDDIPESKLSYLPNGYDPEDCNTELRKSHSSDPALRFFYAGSLYAGKRDLTVLFRALADLSKEGKIVVMPHEYGTYTFRNGVYSEMGRPAVKPEEMMLIDKAHFKGRWKSLNQRWVKLSAMPDKAVRHIVNCCKYKDTPADVQQAVKQNMFR